MLTTSTPFTAKPDITKLLSGELLSKLNLSPALLKTAVHFFIQMAQEEASKSKSEPGGEDYSDSEASVSQSTSGNESKLEYPTTPSGAVYTTTSQQVNLSLHFKETMSSD
jgi:hypothetical protein